MLTILSGTYLSAHFFAAILLFDTRNIRDIIPKASRKHPEGIPKDCSNKFLQKISLHSSGMPPKLLKTPYHPYPSSLTQSSQLTPKLLRTPSQSSLIILPNPSQLPPNFLPNFLPKNGEQEGRGKQATTARLLPQISFFTHKKHFCGELW